MSEFSVYVPPFAPASRALGVPLSAARATDDDIDDADGDTDSDSDDDVGDRGDVPATRVREGLPPSYRMRHEPHYVEALVSRAAPTPLPAVSTVVAVPAAMPLPVLALDVVSVTDRPAGVPVMPSGATAVSAVSLAAAAATFAEAFDAIQAALRDVPVRGRPLRDRVAIELARAEATRGRWLADAALVMQTSPLPALDEVDLARVLRLVIEALGPESRLSGGAADIRAPGGASPVFGDERLLTTAVGASLAAMRAVIDDRGDARKLAVTLSAQVDASMRAVEIVQSAVRVPVAAYGRFFDAEWAEHPAGASGALMLAAARRIAEAHGGSFEIAAIGGGGCRLMLSVPAAG